MVCLKDLLKELEKSACANKVTKNVKRVIKRCDH